MADDNEEKKRLLAESCGVASGLVSRLLGIVARGQAAAPSRAGEKSDRQQLGWMVRGVAPLASARPVALASELLVFSREPTRHDRLPESLTDIFLHWDDPKSSGRILIDDSRLLLGGADSGVPPIYAAPTSSGWVCYVVGGVTGPTCVRDLTNDDVTWTIEIDPRKNAVLHGLIGNGVERAEVSVGGVPYTCATGQNAFYCEIADVRSLSGSITLHLHHEGRARKNITIRK